MDIYIYFFFVYKNYLKIEKYVLSLIYTHVRVLQYNNLVHNQLSACKFYVTVKVGTFLPTYLSLGYNNIIEFTFNRVKVKTYI